jgi:hypothetical protein
MMNVRFDSPGALRYAPTATGERTNERGHNMSCEYAKADKCQITGRPCLVISDLDLTAYRHCLAREWKHKLDDGHCSLLARPCSALDDMQNGLILPQA